MHAPETDLLLAALETSARGHLREEVREASERVAGLYREVLPLWEAWAARKQEACKLAGRIARTLGPAVPGLFPEVLPTLAGMEAAIREAATQEGPLMPSPWAMTAAFGPNVAEGARVLEACQFSPALLDAAGPADLAYVSACQHQVLRWLDVLAHEAPAWEEELVAHQEVLAFEFRRAQARHGLWALSWLGRSARWFFFRRQARRSRERGLCGHRLDILDEGVTLLLALMLSQGMPLSSLPPSRFAA